MVPDNNVHMVTSKHHKNDEKHPTCGAHISIIFWNKKTKTVHPDTLLQATSIFFHIFIIGWVTCNERSAVYFGLGSDQNIFISLQIS